MLNEMTVHKLEVLKLNGMVRALRSQMENPGMDGLTFEERFGMLVDTEFSDRENKKIASLVKNATLRHSDACMEDIIYSPDRKLDKSQIVSLGTCSWIKNKQSVIITGPSGAGKSWLACALGRQACKNGFKTIYSSATNLFDKIQASIADRTILKLKSTLSRADLLVVDDFGIGGIDMHLAPTLLDIVDQQSMNGAIMFTSQFPPENWYDLFNDPTIADAFLDRVVHRSTLIKLRGESLRRKRAKNGTA